MGTAAAQQDIYRAGDTCGLDRSFEVIRLISKGGMGEVYEVRHRSSGQHFALKRLQFRHQQNGMFLDKIKAEAAAGKEMKHPNLVPVYESALDELGGYFVMQLLRGETLGERLHRGAMPPVDALEIGAQVADALYALHVAGIFHRDVKPANIFLTEDGRVMLLDLGAAKFERYGLNTTQSQAPLGTALFMSPEHAHNNPLDGRSDIFSLGHVLYFMLAGHHAFEAFGEKFATANLMNIILWHSTEDVPPLTQTAPHLPKMLWDVVRVAVQRDRDLRYDTASNFAAVMRGAAKVLRGEAETSASRAAAAHFNLTPRPIPALAPSQAPTRSQAPGASGAPAPGAFALAPSPAAPRVGPKGTEMLMSAPERFDAPSAIALPHLPPTELAPRIAHPSPPQPLRPPLASGPRDVQPTPHTPPPAPPHASPPRGMQPAPAIDDRPHRPLFPETFAYRSPHAIERQTQRRSGGRANELSTGQKLGAMFVALLSVAALGVVMYLILRAQKLIP